MLDVLIVLCVCTALASIVSLVTEYYSTPDSRLTFQIVAIISFAVIPMALLFKSKRKIITTDIGRNDLCPCGSGLKYKKCCLKYDKRSKTGCYRHVTKNQEGLSPWRHGL